MGSRPKPTSGPAQAADDSRASALFRQTALTDLARTALLGTPQRPLLEKAARLVQGALNAETCGIYEYLPGGHDLLLRAGAFAPGQRRGLTTVDLTGSAVVSPSVPDGSSPLSAALVVPIGVSPPPFGCLAVLARWDSGFDDDDRQFALLAAGLLSAALERLLADEGQRVALFQDPLTGLPNRALILDHLRLALARAERRPSSVAVLFVDLDRFKLINDTLGHGVGDDMLTTVGHRLRAALRPPDSVGRLGGDEFVAVCEDVGGKSGALAVAERLSAALAAPVRLAGRDLRIRASIGVALSASGSTDPATLLAEADGAMFWAKRRGRNVALFDTRMRVGTGGVLPSEQAAASAVWSHPDGTVPGVGTSAAAGLLIARMTELLAEIKGPDQFDLRDLPAR